MSGKVYNNASSIWIVGLLILALLMETKQQASAASCNEAVRQLQPCKPFLLGQINGVPAVCCNGADALNELHDPRDHDEIKNLCNCLKQEAASVGFIADRAKQIPQLCRITIPVPIYPTQC